MKGSYIDLHTHTYLSDGNLEDETLAHKFDSAICGPILQLLGI